MKLNVSRIKSLTYIIIFYVLKSKQSCKLSTYYQENFGYLPISFYAVRRSKSAKIIFRIRPAYNHNTNTYNGKIKFSTR